MWRFCFARIRLNPLSGKILHHDRNLVQQRDLRESYPWIWQLSVHVGVPIVINTLFLQHIQKCVRRSGHVNVLQKDVGMILLSHVELNSKFNLMTLNEITFDWPRTMLGSTSTFISVGWVRISLNFSHEIFTRFSCSRLRVDSRTP